MDSKELPKTILLIGGSLLAVYAFFRATPAIVERQIEKAKTKATKRKQEEAKEEVKQATGATYKVCKAGKCYYVNLDTMAKVINDSFKGNWFTEDEKRAMSEIRKLPTQPIIDNRTKQKINIAKHLSNIYATKYRRNLKEDFVKYLSASEFRQVANWFNFT